jgi:hypothetical protein
MTEPTKAQLEKQRRKLSKEIKAINTSGVEDLKKALQILNGQAAIDPTSLPTRQQRRRAERLARKAQT